MVSTKFTIIAILIFLGFLGLFVGIFDLFPYELVKNSFENQKNPSSISVYEDNISSQIHITDVYSKNEIKNNLIQFIWKQNNLPNYTPNQIEHNISDNRYLNLRNLDSIEKLTIEMDDGVNSIAYLFHASHNDNQLIIYHQGHRGDFFEGKETIQFFLEKNYSVLAFSMPLKGMNSQPIIEHPQNGKIKLQSHNQFELLENNDYTPIKFFVEPIVVSLNYIEKEYEFESIHMVGISGGGWTAVLITALDDRINQSFSVAGSYPMFLRTEPKNFGDYEQHHSELYEVANYLDLYIIASYGYDRKFVQIFNKFDPCCFDGDSFSLYEQEIEKIVADLGKGYFQIYLDDTHKEHIISNHALKIIINEISG